MQVASPPPRVRRLPLPTAPWRALPIVAITALAGVLRLVSLGGSGTNPFYDAAVRTMGESWHNFFFAAFEPAAGVSIDKPPLDLWLQVGSVKLFGWGTTALILPQALAATAAVPLLYDLARRLFGTAAGIAAALCLALLPVSVLTGRSDTMDSVMMALNVLAAWLVVRAAETGRQRYLLLAAGVVGLNFEVKLFESLVALPALLLLYLLAVRRPLREQLRPLALAAAIAVAVAFAWPAAVSLSSSRPYALGSTNGSVWNAIFVYNGTQRLNPPRYSRPPTPVKQRNVASAPVTHRRHAAHAGGGTLSGSGAAPGALRLFELGGNRFGQNFGVELAGAFAFGGLALLWYAFEVLRRRRAVERLPRAGALAVALWVLTGYVLFSRSRGVVYSRYLEAMAPAVAIAFGAGAVASARLAREGTAAFAGFAAAVVLTTLYAVQVAGSDTALKAVSVAAAALALAAVAAARFGIPRATAAASALCLLPLLIPAAVRSHAVVSAHESDSGGAGDAENSPTVLRESAFLLSHRDGAKYEVATYSFAHAAPLIVRDGQPVMVLTSYTSPVVGAPALARAARRGEVRYALIGGSCGTATGAALRSCPDVIRWLRRHSVDVTARAGLPGTGLLFRIT